MFLRRFCTIKWLIITSLALLIILIGVNILSFVGLPVIIKSEIHKTLQLEEGTIQWDRFKKLPVDLQIKVYFFNISNADEVQNNGSLPHLVEVGPYYYRQTLDRKIVKVGSDSVTYTQIRNLTFDEEKSAPLKESDRVRVINPLLVVATQLVSPIERILAYGCFDNLFPPNVRDFFIEADVGSLVLKGLVFGKSDDIEGSSCNIARNLLIEKVKLMKNVDLEVDEHGSVDHAKFSLLNFIQSRSDGIYTIDRGINEVSQLGNLIEWNEKQEFNYYGTPNSANNDTCKRVWGTDGTIYPPQITKDKELSIFSSEVCSLYGVFSNIQDSTTPKIGQRSRAE